MHSTWLTSEARLPTVLYCQLQTLAERGRDQAAWVGLPQHMQRMQHTRVLSDSCSGAGSAALPWPGSPTCQPRTVAASCAAFDACLNSSNLCFFAVCH